MPSPVGNTVGPFFSKFSIKSHNAFLTLSNLDFSFICLSISIMRSSSCFCDKYFWFLAIFFALFFDNVFVVITDCDSGVSPVYKAKDLESVGLGAVNDFEAYLEVEDLVWTDERAALFLLSDLAWLCANILIFGLLIAFLPAIFAEGKEKI